MSLELKPCPVCGEPVMAGFEHPQCLGLKPSTMAEKTGPNTFVFGPGSDLGTVLNALAGGGFYVRAEQFDFDFTDGSNQRITINITELMLAIAADEVEYDRGLVEIEPEIVMKLIADGSVDQEYCKRLTAKRLDDPVLFIECEKGKAEYALADGQHRYVAKYACDHKDVRAYIVGFDAWQPYGKTIKK